MENNKTLPLDSHSQTPKLLAKPREKQQQNTKQNTTKTKETEPQVLHSQTRYIHSTKPDIIDKSKSIHEQNPKQNSDQKPKTQQSRGN